MTEDPITSLKVVRDIVFELNSFVDSLVQVAEKYQVGINNQGGFDITNSEDVARLSEQLSKEKMGEFLQVLSSIYAMQNDFVNMMNYDKDQLKEFSKRLVQLIDKFDKFLEGL